MFDAEYYGISHDHLSWEVNNEKGQHFLKARKEPTQ